jgi:hypothetical protein
LVAFIVSGNAQNAKRPHFTDIAGKSNFSYRTNNDYHGRKYFPQPLCGGVAAFDFDHDGKMDLFFTEWAKLPELKKTDSSFCNCLVRNKGDGTFEDVTAKAGLAGESLGSASAWPPPITTMTAMSIFLSVTPARTPVSQQRRRDLHGLD